jgi:hypothetical protein
MPESEAVTLNVTVAKLEPWRMNALATGRPGAPQVARHPEGPDTATCLGAKE